MDDFFADMLLWIAANLNVIGWVVVFSSLLMALLPLLIVSLIRHRLPDEPMGLRPGDAFPLTPPANFRLWGFVFSRRALEVSGPAARQLVRLLRIAFVLGHIAIVVMFVSLVSSDLNLEWDPNAAILKSDLERAN